MRRLTTGVLAVGLLWTGVAAAAPQVPTDPVAKDELKQGYELAQANKCAEAIPHLQESLKRDPRAITLINLADCEEKVGKLADATVHWGDARSRASASGEKDIQEEATTRAAALDAKLPHLTLTLSKNAPTDATVERDGVVLGAVSLGVALPVDPGAHVITVHAPGHDDMVKNITMAEGDKQTLDLSVGPVSSAKPTPNDAGSSAPEAGKKKMSLLVPVGFGVGAAGIIVGTITGIMTLGKGSDASDHCKNSVCDSKSAYDSVQSGKTLGAVSTVAFIVGAAGVGVGVVGLLTAKTAEPAPTTAGLDLVVGPTNFALHGRF